MHGHEIIFYGYFGHVGIFDGYFAHVGIFYGYGYGKFLVVISGHVKNFGCGEILVGQS